MAARLNSSNAGTIERVVEVLFKGNVGSAIAFAEIAEAKSAVDPRFSSIEESKVFLALDVDAAGLHDDRLWRLYSDVCGKDARKTAAVICAVPQFLSVEILHRALNPISAAERLDVDAVVRQVQKSIPEYAQIVAAVPEGRDIRPGGTAEPS